jgi:hypothetical protein
VGIDKIVAPIPTPFPIIASVKDSGITLSGTSGRYNSNSLHPNHTPSRFFAIFQVIFVHINTLIGIDIFNLTPQYRQSVSQSPPHPHGAGLNKPAPPNTKGPQATPVAVVPVVSMNKLRKPAAKRKKMKKTEPKRMPPARAPAR